MENMKSKLSGRAKSLYYVAASSAVSLVPAIASAQSANQPTPEDQQAAACATCAGMGGVFIVIPLILFVINIAILVWVARDAKARGMDSAVLWMILVFFLGPIGLVIFLFSRPQGNVIQCGHCGNKRLQASAQCPHCNNA